MGALVLCFPASGETCAFSFGFFPSKWCSFSLVLLWRFVCRLLALFFFWLVGYLCGRLGLALCSPGLVGPPRARDHFGRFFGSPLWRPKWSHGFCRNIQKQMVLGLFMRKGQLAEIISCEPPCSESSCFLECFCEFWWAPFGTKWALWCEFDSFARRFQCFARTPFWSRFGLLCELQALLALWRPDPIAGF